MRVSVVRIAGACCAVLLLASCGAPPLTVFTLSAPQTAVDASPAGRTKLVITVARVSIPDALDTEDIVVRDDGSILRRSRSGRWASRLSLGITDRLTQRLAERRPDALVTDRPLSDAANLRVLVNIERLDVTAAGVATLDADWLVARRDAGAATVPVRGHFSATGPVGSDRDVVTMVGHLVDRLAAAINIGRG
ncbi:PqiC family protein [Rhodopila sp.]|uniref:PqiC family protein n=1 Tax=Rhodopila sp. TaxID=2480087 RepID=UPI003D0CAD49